MKQQIKKQIGNEKVKGSRYYVIVYVLYCAIKLSVWTSKVTKCQFYFGQRNSFTAVDGVDMSAARSCVEKRHQEETDISSDTIQREIQTGNWRHLNVWIAILLNISCCFIVFVSFFSLLIWASASIFNQQKMWLITYLRKKYLRL